jgi:hypothetical protein
MMRTRKIKWARHVERMKEEKYMNGKHEGEESLEDYVWIEE